MMLDFIRRVLLRIAKRDEKPAELGNWTCASAVAAGTKHIQASPPVPCQDAAIGRVETGLRPCLFVADGAGSASLSHFGAQETVLRLSHLAASLEDIHSRLLDAPETPSGDECRLHAHRFLLHALETISHLGSEKDAPFKEFRCTLLAAVAGSERFFWMKLGDGHIIRERNEKKLEVVGPTGKGEYANVTHFVDQDKNRNNAAAAFGLFPAAEISGIAAMTDGAAEKLVSADGKKIAGRLNTFFSDMRAGAFESTHLQSFLSDTDIWKPPGYTGDDKGLALLSRIRGND